MAGNPGEPHKALGLENSSGTDVKPGDLILRAQGLLSLAQLFLSLPCFGECSLADQVSGCPHVHSVFCLISGTRQIHRCYKHRMSPW